MDTLKRYRKIVSQVFNDHIRFVGENSGFQFVPILDEVNDRYVLMMQGWQGHKWVHICIAHLEIINEKIWVQYDGTDYGIANDLLAAGVPKDKIVLGFKSPELRKYTELAAA